MPAVMVVKTPYGEGILKEIRADGIMIIQLRSRAGHGFHGYFNHTQVSLVRQYHLTEGNVNLAPSLLDLHNNDNGFEGQSSPSTAGSNGMDIAAIDGIEVDCTGRKPRRMGKRNSEDMYTSEDLSDLSSDIRDAGQGYQNGVGDINMGMGNISYGGPHGGDENYNCINVNIDEPTENPTHEFEPKRKKSLISTPDSSLSNFSTLQDRRASSIGLNAVSGSGVRNDSISCGLAGRGIEDNMSMTEC